MDHINLTRQSIIIQMKSNRVGAIDYLKGFSIFTIVLMHLLNIMSAIPSKIQTLASIGGAGVHVFFLCSGIGLYLSYLKKKTNYYEFLKRGLSKYIFLILLSFLFLFFFRGCIRGVSDLLPY